MRTVIVGLAVLCLLLLKPNAGAQQNQDMRALAQALHTHDYDRGQGNSYDETPVWVMLKGVHRDTVQTLMQTSNQLVNNPNDAWVLYERGWAASLAPSQNPVMKQGWLHFAAIDLEKSLRINPNNW